MKLPLEPVEWVAVGNIIEELQLISDELESVGYRMFAFVLGKFWDKLENSRPTVVLLLIPKT